MPRYQSGVFNDVTNPVSKQLEYEKSDGKEGGTGKKTFHRTVSTKADLLLKNKAIIILINNQLFYITSLKIRA